MTTIQATPQTIPATNLLSDILSDDSRQRPRGQARRFMLSMERRFFAPPGDLFSIRNGGLVWPGVFDMLRIGDKPVADVARPWVKCQSAESAGRFPYRAWSVDKASGYWDVPKAAFAARPVVWKCFPSFVARIVS